MTKTICDVCGKEIKTESEHVTLRLVAFTDEPNETLAERWYDIHKTHAASIIAGIENLLAKERKEVKQ